MAVYASVADVVAVPARPQHQQRLHIHENGKAFYPKDQYAVKAAEP